MMLESSEDFIDVKIHRKSRNVPYAHVWACPALGTYAMNFILVPFERSANVDTPSYFGLP